MPGMNLTRDEARERARILTVNSYAVELDLTQGEKTFASTTVVRFSCSEPGTSTFIDLVAPRARGISLNGRQLDPATVYDGARIALADLAGDNELRVVADCGYMNTGEGLHRFTDPVDGAVYLYTQFEVPDARRVYACFEQPDLKATFALTVTAPATWQVVSNSPTPNPELVRDSVAIWRFAATPRLSTYVTALVAGPYHVVRDEYRRGEQIVPLGVFCRASLAQFLDAEAIFEVTKQGFDFFLETFDYPYPFAKYDQLFVPEFNAGAMENAGCVTFRDEYVFRSKVTDAAYQRRAETILHELAHMWFGDLVTMQWWDDLWLNESFATYASVLCQSQVTKWPHAWTDFANAMKAWAYRQDQLPTTHPIVAEINDLEDVEVNFDGITYAKGASVLKQLVAWVGYHHFVEGVRSYFQRHAWGNTTLADLLTALEETSGRDLKAWSAEWLETASLNTLRPEITTDAQGRITRFAVRQEAPEQWPTLRSHRLAIGLYNRTTAGLIRQDRIELDVAGPCTEVPELIGRIQPDLVLLNDDDLAYAKIRLDERSQTTLVSGIGEFTDSLPRVLCWTAAWDATRNAEMPARDYLELVLSGIDRETDISVVQFLHQTAKHALDFFVDPAFRPAGVERLAAAAYQHLLAATPGSDHQLAWARCFAATASRNEHLATLRALLDGAQTIEGLKVDTELRWTLLRRLVAARQATESDVDSELERDNTAAGQQHAAACLAARPTSAAKHEAWSQLIDRDDLPNAMQEKTIAGFVQPDQRELLAPFVDRYFAVISDIWANRTNESAKRLVVGFYPSLIVEPSTLARTDRFLAQEAIAPALRRLVLEGRDLVARALCAQAYDRTATTT